MSRFGYFMGDGDSAFALAQELNCDAFAVGKHLYHKPEQYRGQWRVRITDQHGQCLGFAL